MNIADIKYLVTQTFKEWGEDNASRLAAAMAYYTVFSIPPLLILFLVVVGQVYDQAALQKQLIGQVSDLIGETGAEAIALILENASRPGGSIIATIISVATLLFGASGVFGQLHDSLNTIWEVEAKPGGGIVATIKDRFFSFTMVLGVAFLLSVSLILSTTLAAFNEFVNNVIPTLILLAQAVNFVLSFGVITVLFGLIFKVVPDVEVKWRDVWIGAVVTALLFTVGKWGIGLYLGNSAPNSTYGAAGSLIIILLWVYYSAQILFLGAEFTQVYANKYGSRIVADEGAVSLHEQVLETPTTVPINERTALQSPETAVSHLPPSASLVDPSENQALQSKSLKSIEKAVEHVQGGTIAIISYGLAGWQITKITVSKLRQSLLNMIQ